MLIIEELMLVGTSPRGDSLLGTSRNIVVGGAALADLALTERLDLDGRGRLRVLDGGSTGDGVLDQALALFAGKEGKKPKDILEAIGKRMLEPTLESLARQELVRPEPVKALGLTWMTRWPAVSTVRREAVLAELAQVIEGTREADGHSGAVIALLRAGDVLHKVVGKDLRPTLSNGQVRKRGKEISEGRWAPEAVSKAVEDATAAVMASVIAAGGATAASS
ncbi:GOLPH3/VPS74 family protein [Ornithinimicrobium sp. Y1847]|uniref:GOLPH3/VPS74 family protein n=1 Tax=Ornithinimicrobium sp. Y1847 TaxID=3405419 RepID=UPI003B67337B